MKKLFALFSFVLCFVIFSVGVFAADSPIEDKNSTVISVSFKAGTGNYDVNGKTVKAEASVQTGGKTFVPVKVITDALGASLTVDLKAKTALINYNNVDIKLTEKKKEALISGKKVNIDVAPYIKNNSFMASISSLADILGADVSTDNGKITFEKEIANPNSIKDFSTLIKKTTKSKIGDSFYKWSMQLPDDLELGYRDFNGSENVFVSQDGSYFVSVYLFDADKDSNLDNVVNNMKDKIKDFTPIDYVRDINNGADYVEFVYKDDEYTIQERVYITHNTAYIITIYTKNEDSYDDEKYQNLMESFDFTFDKTGSTEDLSDVTKEGYRKYQDTRLKWSINMMPDWEEIKDDKIQNKIYFFGKKHEYVSVEVYSLDKDETLDSITNKVLESDAAEFNPEYYKVTKQEKVKIGEIECNKVYYTLKFPDSMVYGCELFIVDKNYKYIVCSQVTEDSYNTSREKELVDGMLNSFNFKQLDSKVTGKLLDPKKITLADKTQTIKDDLYSLEVPFNWYTDEENDDTFSLFYTDYNSVSVSVINDVPSLSDFTKYMDSNIDQESKYKLESREAITDKGITYYKYVIKYTNKDGYSYKMIKYVMHKGTKAYVVTFMVDDVFYGTKNIDINNKIWQSFTLK